MRSNSRKTTSPHYSLLALRPVLLHDDLAALQLAAALTRHATRKTDSPLVTPASRSYIAEARFGILTQAHVHWYISQRYENHHSAFAGRRPSSDKDQKHQQRDVFLVR